MLYNYSKKLKRIPGKLKFSLLNFPIIRFAPQLLYERRLASFSASVPRLNTCGTGLIDLIGREGAIVTSLDEFPFRAGPSLLNAVDQLLPELRSNDSAEENSIRISHEHIIRCPDIYVWGLDETLLDVAENCIGLPAFYHRVEIRRDLVNKSTPTPASQWHRDPADRRIFKFIIYLNDVPDDGGPFEFISRSHSEHVTRALKYKSGYIPDSIMERYVPREQWNRCTGVAGSVVVGDTASIFHRIRAPEETPRLSITFTYTSRRPLRIYDEVTLPPADIAAISKHLSERQRRCLFLD